MTEATEVATRVRFPRQGGRKPEKKLNFPNMDEYHTKINAERKAIETLHKEMDDIANRVSEIRSEQSSYYKERSDLRKSLDDITDNIERFEGERAELLTEIEKFQKISRDKQNQLQSLKKNLQFQTKEDIDAKVKALERHMMHNRLTVQEENKVIAQIKQLKANKPLLEDCATLELDANNYSQANLIPLKTRFDEVRKQIKKLQERKRELTESASKLIQGNQKVQTDLRELKDEQDRIRKKIMTHRYEASKLAEELKIKSKEYYASQAQIQKNNLEKRREERRKLETEHTRERLQKELDDLNEIGVTDEYQLTQQTILYIKQLLELYDDTPEPASLSTEHNDILQKQTDTEDGMVVYVKAKNRDDNYHQPKTKKKPDKKKKISLKQPLVHGILVLADFDKLSIQPPLTIEQCPSCLKQLEQRMKKLKEEQALSMEATAKKKQELIAKIEALEAEI